jgi:ketosteroid isomerase-like protein
MRLLPLLSLLLASACAATSVSEDERDALDTVRAFFDVIASKDAEAGARILVPEGVFVNVRVEDGRRTLRHFTSAEWLAQLPDATEEWLEAFEGRPTVLVQGDAAVVWGRYRFEVDGELSHTGTDAFNLLRTDEGWKIAGGVYTVER